MAPDLFWDIVAVIILTSPVWFTAIIVFAYWPRKHDYDEHEPSRDVEPTEDEDA